MTGVDSVREPDGHAPTWRLMLGDVREQLALLPAESVQCCVTSPPYWSLRDYGVPPAAWGGDPSHEHVWQPIERQAERYTGKRKWQHIGEEAQAAGVKVRDVDPNAWGHPKVSDTAFCECGAWLGVLGLEPTPELFIEHTVSVFREVRRVLRKDGTLWVNMGDSYQAAKGQAGGVDPKQPARRHGLRPNDITIEGLKPKDLVGVPWMLAFALRADGWYLRSDIIWSKPNPMPESVTDRPTKAHEYVFLLSKSRTYYYDADAIRTKLTDKTLSTFGTVRNPIGDGSGLVKSENYARDVPVRKPRMRDKQRGHGRRHAGFNDRWDAMPKDEQQFAGANCRSVWDIATQPYPEAHFATFPEALPTRCIQAGSRVGDVVLDPFTGSGTTGAMAIRLGRSFVGCELNPDYLDLARKRIGEAAPLFAEAVGE